MVASLRRPFHQPHVLSEPGGKRQWVTRHCPPGSDNVFTFGQHRGYTYNQVLHQYPGYYVWGGAEPEPSRILCEFLDWVDMYYDVDLGTHQVSPKPDASTPIQHIGCHAGIWIER